VINLCKSGPMANARLTEDDCIGRGRETCSKDRLENAVAHSKPQVRQTTLAVHMRWLGIPCWLVADVGLRVCRFVHHG